MDLKYESDDGNIVLNDSERSDSYRSRRSILRRPSRMNSRNKLIGNVGRRGSNTSSMSRLSIKSKRRSVVNFSVD